MAAELKAINHLTIELPVIQAKDLSDDVNDNKQPNHQFHYKNDGFVGDIPMVTYPENRLMENLEEVAVEPKPNKLGDEVSTHEQENFISSFLTSVELTFTEFYRSHRKIVLRLVGLICFVLYNVFLGYAIHLKWSLSDDWCDGVRLLVLITCLVYFLILYYNVFKVFLLPRIDAATKGLRSKVSHVSSWPWFSRLSWISIFSLVLAFLIWDSSNNRARLISVAGLVILILLGYIFSAHPRKVVWKHVFSGIILQFLLGLLVLRWRLGQDVFNCLSNKTKRFLEFTDDGSSFVFGYLVTGVLKGITQSQEPVFAFKVLSVIIFFSFIVGILYYYGIMQVLVVKVGWVLQSLMGTTACESMNAAANIFLGMTEAPLMIKPYLPIMTKSELHAVMTGGFATIAGAVLAAFIELKVNPSHLLSASVMSAPAALGYSKLFYPETEVSKTKSEDIVIGEREERNAIEAAANGASSAVALVANVAANLIAFLAAIAFLNANLAWFGSLIGWEFLSFEWLLGQAFRPLAFIMGVNWSECQHVGKLIGLKTIVNEFYAYSELAKMKKEGLLSPRAEAISVFALCGFSNISSIGIMIGGLTTLAPQRKSDIASVAVRAMIAGSAACFTTACVAGALLESVSIPVTT